MIKKGFLKQQLAKRELTIGSWLNFGYPPVAEVMAAAGFTWLVIDMEHSAVTIDQAQCLMQVIKGSGVVPLVRVGENNAYLIKQALDAGAHGVIVPMINSRAEAERAVQAVKYPPEGTRGVGLARAQGYGFEFEEYKKWLKNESVVIAQIEHIQAIDNLTEILTVPGIDGSIIGPYDLSGSLGFPGEFEKKSVKEALQRYETVCQELKKPLGIHSVAPDPEQAKQYIKKGYTFLAVGVDMLYLGQKCRDVLKGINK